MRAEPLASADEAVGEDRCNRWLLEDHEMLVVCVCRKYSRRQSDRFTDKEPAFRRRDRDSGHGDRRSGSEMAAETLR